MDRTSVGYVNGSALADMASEMFADEGVTAEPLGDGQYQVFVTGDRPELEHAELSGRLQGLAFAIQSLREAGLV